jgi:PAS domain-containing protein
MLLRRRSYFRVYSAWSLIFGMPKSDDNRPGDRDIPLPDSSTSTNINGTFFRFLSEIRSLPDSGTKKSAAEKGAVEKKKKNLHERKKKKKLGSTKKQKQRKMYASSSHQQQENVYAPVVYQPQTPLPVQDDQQEEQQKQRRKKSKMACNRCRRLHRACDGGQPCTRCSKTRPVSICDYAQPKKRGRKRLDQSASMSSDTCGKKEFDFSKASKNQNAFNAPKKQRTRTSGLTGADNSIVGLPRVMSDQSKEELAVAALAGGAFRSGQRASFSPPNRQIEATALPPALVSSGNGAKTAVERLQSTRFAPAVAPLNHSADGHAVIDERGFIVTCDAAFAACLERSAAEVLGRHLQQLLHPTSASAVLSRLHDARHDEHAKRAKCIWQMPDNWLMESAISFSKLYSMPTARGGEPSSGVCLAIAAQSRARIGPAPVSATTAAATTAAGAATANMSPSFSLPPFRGANNVSSPSPPSIITEIKQTPSFLGGRFSSSTTMPAGANSVRLPAPSSIVHSLLPAPHATSSLRALLNH